MSLEDEIDKLHKDFLHKIFHIGRMINTSTFSLEGIRTAIKADLGYHLIYFQLIDETEVNPETKPVLDSLMIHLTRITRLDYEKIEDYISLLDKTSNAYQSVVDRIKSQHI